ncbi:MAG: hypothetical protein QXN23_03700 [Candidatus Caldarchaeum sp.]|jgi:peptidoglycan hydrolase CwlO-like protein|uniref:DUF4201 domain-containing protein n=1 Tax=Caldiarchaeum subterraneum TaxID=311458 RepID=A0A7C4HXI0_CALS0|nr:hypothetical protein [Candidatus Caldarchaeales archaeon]
MRGFVLSLLMLVLLLPLAAADGFSSLVDDARLKVVLNYPVEVRLGDCFTLVLQVTFLGDVDVDKMWLKVSYTSEAGTTTLLQDNLVSTPTFYPTGSNIVKTYSLCIPNVQRRDPLVTATFYANYTRETAYQPLTHTWHIAAVRTRTYQDLLNDLNRAQEQINQLRTTIQTLETEINRLRTRLEEALNTAATLMTRLNSSREEIHRLEQRLQTMSDEYRQLNDRFVSTVGELKALQATYETLRRENEALSTSYQQLLHDYRNLTREYSMLQASFNQLHELYEGLVGRHESAKQQIGYLQSQLDETSRELADLRLRYSLLSDENLLHRNIAYAEAFLILAAVVAAASYGLSRRRMLRSPPALPPPPPPPNT